MTYVPPSYETMLRDHLGYSLRRYYVDEYFLREAALLPEGARVIDLGGKKLNKRGRFDIGRYPVRVEYVNTDASTEPDVLGDVAAVPVGDAQYDAAICSEVLEHVPDPPAVLREAFRLLKPGGRFLTCTPFLYPVHGDPQDYGRYTDHYWRVAFAAAGFTDVRVEPQGYFWSVLVDMLRGYFDARSLNERWPRRPWVRKALRRAVYAAFRRAVAADARPKEGYPYAAHFTTGFAVTAVRPPAEPSAASSPASESAPC